MRTASLLGLGAVILAAAAPLLAGLAARDAMPCCRDGMKVACCPMDSSCRMRSCPGQSSGELSRILVPPALPEAPSFEPELASFGFAASSRPASPRILPRDFPDPPPRG